MFFLQITANSPYPKISNETWNVFYLIHGVKIRKFLFFNHKPISSFVHLTSQKVFKMAMFEN